MRQIFAPALTLLLLAAPAGAQEPEDPPPSLMERGAQLFFEGLLEEMSPAMEEAMRLMEDAGPALSAFLAEMGPKLQSMLEEVEDWSAYEAPEIMPNGDIIIRRKPQPPEPPAETPQQGEPAAPIEL